MRKFIERVVLYYSWTTICIIFYVPIAHAESLRATTTPIFSANKKFNIPETATYDHRQRKTLDPVRSPHDKPLTGGLVVRWVTTGESPLLYVFCTMLNSFKHIPASASPLL
jgi:hypothetical protein